MKTLKVGIWGCGGISSLHRQAYECLEKRGAGVKLAALCDIDDKKFNSKVKINISSAEEKPLPRIDKCYTDIDEMLEKEDLDIVDICLPTFLHKEACIKALKKNINVLVEKPMSFSGRDCSEILSAAEKSAGKLMVGHCVRFMKHYSFLKEIIDKKKYGRIISGEFCRLSPYPAWRNKAAKDGGVIFDLHIHDVDFVQSIFGIPKAICAVSANNKSDCDTVSTLFKYDDFFINIKADWGLPQSFEFTSPWRVNFENAALEFDGNEKIVLYRDNKCVTLNDIEITHDYITEEIAYFVNLIKNNSDNWVNNPESSAISVKLAGKINESVSLGGQTVVLE